MPDTRSCTYEDLYYEMWEISQRYHEIAEFRVIGKSHDERMIPMVELGKGSTCVFCLSGLTGMDRQTPDFLIRMMQEYTKNWENGWKIEEENKCTKKLSFFLKIFENCSQKCPDIDIGQ